MTDASSNRPDLDVTRVRHPLKFRSARVVRVVPITPHLIRVTLAGEDLRDFESASFDDHVKVFFPAAGDTKPVLPMLGADGAVRDSGAARARARDFTPRRFDQISGELDIEFVLHDAGPATTWAAAVEVGQYLGIGGPRGSFVIPTAFDWHLFIGDDTALPAIARRLEELPEQARAIVVAEVAASYAQIDFKSRADMHIVWAHRTATNDAGLLEALDALPALPAGEGYAWAAGEAATVRRIRIHLLQVRGLAKSRIRTAAYWKHGAQAIHEVIDD